MNPETARGPRVFERREKIAGFDTFWHEVPVTDGATPTLYVHGVPSNADDWSPFLARTGGVAVDLIGFGRSEKPMHFDGSIGSYNAFLQALVAQLGWERFNLVVNDWGALALVTAQELHERIARYVVINAVPLLPGYSWHRTARIWRTPFIGEFAMGLTLRRVLERGLRSGRPEKRELPQRMLDSIWDNFDHGTQRAILKLYRGAPPKQLEEAGERISQLTAPGLVIWGEQDPWIDKQFAERYAETLPDAQLQLLPDAGHWPWLDRPDVVDTVVNFLAGGEHS